MFFLPSVRTSLVQKERKMREEYDGQHVVTHKSVRLVDEAMCQKV